MRTVSVLSRETTNFPVIETSCNLSTVFFCVLSFSYRYIRSERSVILINFCLSIISSNALILIGQTQTRNKVRNWPDGSVTSQCLSQPNLIHKASLCSPPFLSLRFQVLCTLIAAFLHFFFLSSFCWVLTEAWQSYMAVTGRLRNRIIRKRFLCLGWGGPSVCCLSCFPVSLSSVLCSRLMCLFSQVSLHWWWRSQLDSPRRKAMEHQASKHVFH